MSAVWAGLAAGAVLSVLWRVVARLNAVEEGLKKTKAAVDDHLASHDEAERARVKTINELTNRVRDIGRSV